MSSDPARKARGRAVVVALASGAALFAVVAPTWFAVRVTTLLQPEATVAVNGATAVPALTGVALVLLAAGAALGIVGRSGRRVVGALVALSGAVAGWLTLAAVGAPEAALRRTAAEQTGVGAVPEGVTTSPWPFVTLALALVVLAVGVIHLRGSGPWPTPGSRVRRGEDRPGNAGLGDAASDPTTAWDALSEGDDPTAPRRLP